MKKLFYLLSAILICICGFFAYKEQLTEKEEYTKAPNTFFDDNVESFEVNVNSRTNLSKRTKNDILNHRKNYVNSSIFAPENYKPSENIFGKIEDKKAWLLVNGCGKDTGKSKNSFEINNPSIPLLIDVVLPVQSGYPENTCNSMQKPYKVTVYPKKKLIEIRYHALKGQDFYYINGINAADFGYTKVKITKEKSSNIPKFISSTNIIDNALPIKDKFYYTEKCAEKDGCNIISIPQTPFKFALSPSEIRNEHVLYFELINNNNETVEEKIIIDKESDYENYFKKFIKYFL